jgi:hypothetical protein
LAVVRLRTLLWACGDLYADLDQFRSRLIDMSISLFLLVSLFVLPGIAWAPPSGEQISKELRSKTFRLKTHEEAFGKPRSSSWNGRKIYAADIRIAGSAISDFRALTNASQTKRKLILINGNRDWTAKHFVSKKAFVVSEVRVTETTVEVKLQAEGQKGGTELNLNFIGLDDFGDLFNGIFFRTGDDIEAYEDEVNELLIATYIDSEFDSSRMKEEEKLELLRDLQSLSSRGYPEIEVHNERAYARVRLPNRAVSNRFHGDKDKRILTSAQTAMQDAKSLIQAAGPKSSYIQGYVFYWQASYRTPFEEQPEATEDIKLMTPRSVFADYEKGKLSILETIEKSVLKVDGERYSLTPHDPES